MNTIFKLLFIVTLFGSLSAERLSFNAGDAARYTLSQKVDVNAFYVGEYSNTINSNASIEFDVKTLSSNPDTLGFPYEVEVVLKKVLILETHKEGRSKRQFTYDSSNSKSNKSLHKYYAQLIDTPLRFRIDENFHVEESGDFLAELYEDSAPSIFVLFGGSPYTYELFLSNLFHFSAEEIDLNGSFPLNCFDYLNWDNWLIDAAIIDLNQTGAYTIYNTHGVTIEAEMQAEATVEIEDEGLSGELSGNVLGAVQCSIANPLVQQRDFTLNFKFVNKKLPAGTKFKMHQSWQSVPLDSAKECV